MATVNIDGNDFEVYASVAQADVFLLGDVMFSSVWETATNQEQALVSATRFLDRQTWQGEKTGGDSQVLEWPRSGVLDKYGQPVSDATVPTGIFNASMILAAFFIQKASAYGKRNTGSNLRRAKAGSAEVEFFKGTSGLKVPDVVADLIVEFLSSGATLMIPGVYGTGEQRALEDEYGLSEGY